MTDSTEPATLDEEPAAPSSPTRPRWFLPVLIAVGVVVLAIIAVGITLVVAAVQPHTFAAKGAVLVSGSPCDDIPAGYTDIRQGAQVAVKDPAGKTIALGELGEPKDIGDGLGCSYFFTVKDVPSGLSIYGVEVTHRGVLQYKEAVLKKDGASMSIGD